MREGISEAKRRISSSVGGVSLFPPTRLSRNLHPALPPPSFPTACPLPETSHTRFSQRQPLLQLGALEASPLNRFLFLRVVHNLRNPASRNLEPRASRAKHQEAAEERILILSAQKFGRHAGRRPTFRCCAEGAMSLVCVHGRSEVISWGRLICFYALSDACWLLLGSFSAWSAWSL